MKYVKGYTENSLKLFIRNIFLNAFLFVKSTEQFSRFHKVNKGLHGINL